jgi:hypothetical protein
MHELLIRIKKGNDDTPDSLACVRPDGSATWSRVHAVFPVHDLTHLAVESLLGLREAFYGLVARGWDLGDFGSPWPRGPLPREAGLAEWAVAAFQADFEEGQRMTPEEVRARLYPGETPWELAPEQVERIRSLQREFIARWREVPPKGTLELPFPYPMAEGKTGQPEPANRPRTALA